jgi:hypothetical protein
MATLFSNNFIGSFFEIYAVKYINSFAGVYKKYIYLRFFTSMGRSKKLSVALLSAFAVETLCVTWGLKIAQWVPFFSILYFLSGIGIAGLLLYFPLIKFPAPGRKAHTRPRNHYRLIITGLLALIMYSWCRYWFGEMPIDITTADMLPIIKVMGERFIAGQHSHIYDSIPWIWHGTQPIYLPAMWLPYVPAIAIGVDMRWVTMLGLLFAFGAFVFVYRPDRGGYLSFFTGVLAFLLFWWIVADNSAGIVSVSEEGVVIGYYVLLVLALASGKPWLTAIAASLCMLSRYALVGWIPAYVLYLLLEKKWKQLGILTLTGIGCFVLLFLVPVGWPTFLRLAGLPGNYVAFAGRVWKDSPDVFRTAPGLALFFGPHRVGLLHGILITLSFAAPLGLVAFYFVRGRSLANLPLAALKLTLVVFYCFIDVPYLYLFYTSSLVSLILVTLLMRDPPPLISGSGSE